MNDVGHDGFVVDETGERWWAAVMLPPDRSKYRFPPYWYPDEPLPLADALAKHDGDVGAL